RRSGRRRDAGRRPRRRHRPGAAQSPGNRPRLAHLTEERLSGSSTTGRLTFRAATPADLPAIVALLADDPLGARREKSVLPLPGSYAEALAAIDRDPNN